MPKTFVATPVRPSVRRWVCSPVCSILCSIAVVSHAAAPPVAEPVEASLLWRSSEVGGGVILADVQRIVPTETGVFVVHQSLMSSIELVSIDAEGTTGTEIEITGEAPGHLNRPAGVDVSVDGTTLAVVSSVPARLVVRSPVQPPFELTETFEPFFEAGGMPVGQQVRLVDGAVVSHMGQQPMSDLNSRDVRIVRHDRRGDGATVLHQATGTLTHGLDSPMLWVWDASPDGTVFVNHDFHSSVIEAYESDGTQRWRITLPVEAVRKSDAVIEANRESIEKQRGRIPDELLPVLLEDYRVIDEIGARAGDGRLRVLAATDRDRGVDTIGRVSWWLVDMATGEVVGRESLVLPGGEWSYHAIAWLGDRVYFAGADATRGGEPEVLCLERGR